MTGVTLRSHVHCKKITPDPTPNLPAEYLFLDAEQFPQGATSDQSTRPMAPMPSQRLQREPSPQHCLCTGGGLGHMHNPSHSTLGREGGGGRGGGGGRAEACAVRGGGGGCVSGLRSPLSPGEGGKGGDRIPVRCGITPFP